MANFSYCIRPVPVHHDGGGVGPVHRGGDDYFVASLGLRDSLGGFLRAHFLQRYDTPSTRPIQRVRQELCILVAFLLSVERPNGEVVLVVPVVLTLRLPCSNFVVGVVGVVASGVLVFVCGSVVGTFGTRASFLRSFPGRWALGVVRQS